jgi:acyl-CoA reductase-like NAD-dependent aldehyde dehydrogenase
VKQLLQNIAHAIESNQEELAVLMAKEIGKPITFAHKEIIQSAGYFHKLAPLADRDVNPVGRVGLITPFNFPIQMTSLRLAPALAASCPVVHKPSTRARKVSEKFRDLLFEAGLPGDYYQMHFDAENLFHQEIAWLGFVGSNKIGNKLREKNPSVHLELGSAAPAIVAADADLDLAAAKIIKQGYDSSGQSCISIQRVFAFEKIHDELVEKLSPGISALVMGDPLDEQTTVGPLISEEHAQKSFQKEKAAMEMGAQIAAGELKIAGRFFSPLLLKNVTQEMILSQEEIFAPLVCVTCVRDFDEAAYLANLSERGTQAWIFTRDIQKGQEVAENLNYEGVTLNSIHLRSRKLDPVRLFYELGRLV